MNDNAYDGASEAELGFLKEIVRMLPAGLTVQDAQGKLLLVNDVAAAQLGMDGSRPSPDLAQRREACERALKAGQPVTSEEALQDGAARQVLLTTHRPVQLAGRELLISASADITEQKNFEDQLFRSAYFDELTGLPSRRVIEHRANSLLARDGGGERFALAFLDVDNFKHINDYYGHTVGDALLVELSKRLGRDLRDSDMLSRISGDEFLLLLSPIQSQEEVAEFLQCDVGAADRAVLHRQFGGLRLHLGRRQPLSRSWPQLRDAAPECRHRDVSHQEQRQGICSVLRCRHGARGAWRG